MKDIEAKTLESRVRATEIFAVRTFPNVSKCWHHYMAIKLELLRQEPFLSYGAIDYQKEFFTALGTMIKKYPVHHNQAMYDFYVDRFESARTYQERKMWEVH